MVYAFDEYFKRSLSMDKEIAKAINDVSRRLTEAEQKIELFLLNKHEQNKEAISITDDGVVDIADILNTHDEAIADLANVISEISEMRER